MERPWESEPDSQDFESHGLPCAMRRGPGGHWCGYVGVPESHPWFGKDYSHQVKVPEHVIQRDIDIDKIGAINMLCASLKSDAMVQGFIDIVLAVDVHGGLTYASESPPERDGGGHWWFGFDCAHSGDLCPKYESPSYHRADSVYRDMAYVRNETESLAKQLAGWAASSEPEATP